MKVKQWLVALLVIALGLVSAGCENTVEGIQEDTQENVSELNEEVNEENS